MKYVSIDIETTGLQTETCDIIEFGAVMDDLNDPRPLCKLPVFHCYFTKENFNGNPYALSMHPKIFRRIANKEGSYSYLNATKFGYVFKKFLTQRGYEEENGRVYINAAGKNFGSMDLQFLNAKTDLNNHVKIRHRILDPGSMFATPEDADVPGTRECLIRSGYSPNITHTAVADAVDVIKMVRFKMLGLTHAPGQDSIEGMYTS